MLLPYVLFVFCMLEVIFTFKSLRAGSHVCSPYVVSLRNFAYYVVGKESAVAMHLSLWYVVLVCHQYDVYKNVVCMLLGMLV